MDKPHSRRWFSRSQPPIPENDEVEAVPVEVEADRGDADVQFGLGFRCANGQGVARDYEEAARWYLKAANQNHPLAQFNLGVMYARGQGMPRDKAKSMMWIQKAAHLGDAGAQYNLGMSRHRASLHGLPEHAPESRIEAYKWFQLAAGQGYQGSEDARVLVTFGMTRDDVTEAGRRVAAFSAGQPDQAQFAEF